MKEKELKYVMGTNFMNDLKIYKSSQHDSWDADLAYYCRERIPLRHHRHISSTASERHDKYIEVWIEREPYKLHWSIASTLYEPLVLKNTDISWVRPCIFEVGTRVDLGVSRVSTGIKLGTGITGIKLAALVSAGTALAVGAFSLLIAGSAIPPSQGIVAVGLVCLAASLEFGLVAFFCKRKMGRERFDNK